MTFRVARDRLLALVRGHSRGDRARNPEEPVVPTPVTQERHAPDAEPSPADASATGGGRGPAPLGSEGEEREG
jgi:hypothetical protein